MNADVSQVHAQIVNRAAQLWATLPAEDVRAAHRELASQLEEAAFSTYKRKLEKGERVYPLAETETPQEAPKSPVLGTPSKMVAGIPPAPQSATATVGTAAAPAPAGGVVEAPVENPKEPKE